MNRSLLDAGWASVRRRWPAARPRCGLILGSGWGAVADAFSVRDSLAYAEVPGLGAASVAGHEGRLIWGDLAGVETFVFQGRRHVYEGAGWEPVALPVFVLRQAGASAVAITNAAGGLAEDLEPGAFMALSDHINLMGGHPLIGPHDPDWGPRFPDLTQVYAPGLRRAFLEAAARHGCAARAGIYLAVSGPVFETPAEVRAFRGLGADAVGMSTVPEAVLAHASGLRVLGVSCISNRAAGLGTGPLSHDDVQRVMAAAAGRVRPVLAEVWLELGRS
jgi:purine-nucleoside phosphorylase